MKKVQIKSGRKLGSTVGAIGCLFLLASCGDYKSIVEAPKVSLDPAYKLVTKKAGDDPEAKNQWALTKVDAATAWQAVGLGTRRMRVAILSSGVDYNHEDLQANLFLNQKENTGAEQLSAKPVDKKDSDGNDYIDDLLGWDVVEGDGFPYDNLGDGTAAAGIVGAVHNNGVGIKGIVGEVTIVPVRYIDSTGASSIERLIEALRYVNKLSPRPDVVLVQVANVNFASTQGFEATGLMTPGQALDQKEVLNEQLKKLETDDVPVIVSAGNRTSDIEKANSVIVELSKRKNVIIVTSTDENDNKPPAANFSPKYVLTSAPGVNILTTAPGNKYATAKGTFLAAAHVAGAVTLALAKYHGKISTGDLKKELVKGDGSSDVIPALTAYTLGSNRLNVGKFISSLLASRPE